MDLKGAMRTEENAFLSYATMCHAASRCDAPRRRASPSQLGEEQPKECSACCLFCAQQCRADLSWRYSLIINHSTVPHGCSAKLVDYDNAHVNVMYMYPKSAVVHGNNNKIPMTAEARERAERIWATPNEAGRSQPHLQEDVPLQAAQGVGRSNASAAASEENGSGDEDRDVRFSNPLPDRMSSQSSDVRPSNPLPDRTSFQSALLGRGRSSWGSSGEDDVLRHSNPLPDRRSSQSSSSGRGTSNWGSGAEDGDVQPSKPLPDRNSSQSSSLIRGTSSRGEVRIIETLDFV
jgi:hypothetical protein